MQAERTVTTETGLPAESLSEMRRHAAIIRALSASLTAYNADTMRHCRAVARLAGRVARQMGLPSETVLDIQMAALLHDLGKVGIPQDIIEKPGALTISERRLVERHAAIGAEMVSASRLPDRLLPILYHHHERWDGKGYPERLKGHQIPLGARILAVVDTFDAMTGQRPYNRRKTEAEAMAEIRRQSGRQFDPRVVHAFACVMSGRIPDHNAARRSAPAARPAGSAPYRQSRLPWLPALAAAVVLAVLAPRTAGPGMPERPGTAAIAVATVAIDINPSVELDVDRSASVTAARGVNADGRALLQGMSLVGMDLRAATASVARRASEMGKLPEGGVVLATAVPLTPDAPTMLSALAAQGARDGIAQARRTAAVLVARAEPAALNAAHRTGLPLGKYLLAHQAAATGRHVDLAALSAESVAKVLRQVQMPRDRLLMAFVVRPGTASKAASRAAGGGDAAGAAGAGDAAAAGAQPDGSGPAAAPAAATVPRLDFALAPQAPAASPAEPAPIPAVPVTALSGSGTPAVQPAADAAPVPAAPAETPATGAASGVTSGSGDSAAVPIEPLTEVVQQVTGILP